MRAARRALARAVVDRALRHGLDVVGHVEPERVVEGLRLAVERAERLGFTPVKDADGLHLVEVS